MAETLGSLCDKLTIVKLKQWHSDDPRRLESLAGQERRLREEIDELLAAAFAGAVPPERLSFAANKVYKRQGHELEPPTGSVGELFGRLAHVNCKLWHEQEKVYAFEQVPAGEKDGVVRNLALFNLERTQCIDAIDNELRAIVERRRSGG